MCYFYVCEKEKKKKMRLQSPQSAESRTIRLAALYEDTPLGLDISDKHSLCALHDQATTFVGLWRICERVCGKDTQLLRDEARQRPWLQRSLDLEHLEDHLARSHDRFLIGSASSLADLWVSICVSTQHYPSSDRQFPATVAWIENVKAEHPRWMEVQCEILDQSGAADGGRCSPQVRDDPRPCLHKQEAPLLARHARV